MEEVNSYETGTPDAREGLRGDFAAEYARKHRAYAEKFGKEFADKLAGRGFQQGRILDAGCSPGATTIVLAQAFPQSEVVGSICPVRSCR
ncbi:MAG TPA: class I SAM-dependent methyltransferase [Anaerolineae bacterium]|jgi:hypothetical protein|nr:class I SAM-dependent methyltransferase [Anaerolineae bacterium]